MKSQEEAITQETEYISTTMQAIQKYKLIRHKYYNFEIGEPPVYKPASDYEFTCEYCDNKIRGKSTDEKGCSNCGASYKENLELLVREEEDRLEKRKRYCGGHFAWAYDDFRGNNSFDFEV